MKPNYKELATRYERGEISFDAFLTTETAPEPYVVKNARHRGRRAAAQQGAVLAPAKNEVLESNSVCAVCGNEAVGFKSLCCEANVVKPSEYARRVRRAGVEQPTAPQQAPLADEEGAYVAAPGNLRTAEAALKFITAGNAYFTVRSLKTGVRYTFRVALAPVKENCSWCRRTPCSCKRPYFASYLSGPDNTGDYTYLGMITDSVFRVTRASQRLAESTVFKAFDYVYRHLVRRELPPQTEIWHEGRCGVCGRALTVPESIESGIGPVCAGKEGM